MWRFVEALVLKALRFQLSNRERGDLVGTWTRLRLRSLVSWASRDKHGCSASQSTVPYMNDVSFTQSLTCSIRQALFSGETTYQVHGKVPTREVNHVLPETLNTRFYFCPVVRGQFSTENLESLIGSENKWACKLSGSTSWRTCPSLRPSISNVKI
jgi:hypothetical protein